MTKKSILIIGSGGREHALGWKLKQSPKVSKIYFAPGNAGTDLIGENLPIDALDTNSLIKFALKNHIDLTIVGPDDALAKGVVDTFQKKGLRIFGPKKRAAQIESSKAFAKKLMREQNIPTAKHAVFKDFKKAKAYLSGQSLPIVIKASGLALGKGVIIANTRQEAEKTLADIMVNKIFGDAGNEVILEEYLQGHEVSIHVFSDGNTFKLFPTARDHKPIFDDNRGPNTGGMGTIAPLPYVTKKQLKLIAKTVVEPVIRGMKKRGIPFTGLLYPGLMMTKDGPKVLEFNARFGDPETQSYMRLLKTDLLDILLSCVEGSLSKQKISWSTKSACCIILASDGYPGNYKKGEVIHGLKKVENDKNIFIFHAGTKLDKDITVTNGGRVLGVTATGKTLKEALKKAYSIIGQKKIHFTGMQYRKDIGFTG